MRKTYWEKLKRHKKQRTKDEKADDYMREWMERLTENVRYDAWYDPSYRRYLALRVFAWNAQKAATPGENHNNPIVSNTNR